VRKPTYKLIDYLDQEVNMVNISIGVEGSNGCRLLGRMSETGQAKGETRKEKAS